MPSPRTVHGRWGYRVRAPFWNDEERRLRALWRLVALAVLLGGAGLAIRSATVLPERGTPAFFATSTTINFLVTIAGIWLASRLLDRRRFSDYGLHLGRPWWEDLGFGLLLGAVLMTGVFVAQWVMGWVKVVGVLRKGDPSQPFGMAIAIPLLVFVVVGFVEELVARGYLLRNVAEGLAFRRLGGARTGLLVACAVSSALFALGHAGNPNATWVSTVNIALAGVLLALGLLLTGELALSIGLHVTWNFFQASVFGFPVSGVNALRTTFVATEQIGPDLWTGGAFGPEAGLIGLAAMIAGVLAIVGWVRWRHGEIRLAVALAGSPMRGQPAVTRDTLAGTGA